jgi:hypothetical protein
MPKAGSLQLPAIFVACDLNPKLRDKDELKDTE